MYILFKNQFMVGMTSQYNNPIDTNLTPLLQMNQLSMFSEISSRFSISTSPMIVWSIKRQPTEPSEKLL